MNWLLIYFMTFLDGANGLFFAGAIVAAVASTVLAVTLLICYESYDPSELKKLCERWLRRTLTCAIACAIATAVTPTTNDLLRAYLMVEGSKIVTAENAEKAASEVVKRIDKALGLLKRKGVP